jgi:hypothetical protein
LMPITADYELSKIHRDTLPGNESAVGADLSCAPPIYRPTGTLPRIPIILFIVIISPRATHNTSRFPLFVPPP